MSISDHHVRQMTQDDIEECAQLIRNAGLPAPTSALKVGLAVEPNGFFIVVNNKTNEIMAVCGCVSHDPRVVYVGPYAVRNNLQGRGIAIKAWQACMDYIGDRNAGLGASPKGAPLYHEKGGFGIVDPFKQWAFGSRSPNVSNLNSSPPPGIALVKFHHDLEDKVISYDESVIRVNRQRLLRHSLREDKSLILVATDGDQVVGYGCLKLVDDTCTKMGAIYADTPAIAEYLVHQLIVKFELIDARNSRLIWILIDQNPNAVQLAEKLGCKLEVEVTRFYTKFVPQPPADISRLYGINSPSTGPF